MVDNEIILKNVIASMNFEGLKVPEDKIILMRRFLNKEITLDEFTAENNKRIKKILDKK